MKDKIIKIKLSKNKLGLDISNIFCKLYFYVKTLYNLWNFSCEFYIKNRKLIHYVNIFM